MILIFSILIEPVGIETYIGTTDEDRELILIEPVGIETFFMQIVLDSGSKILIEPVGIETIMCRNIRYP